MVSAAEEASRVGQIGFPEFTAKLVTDTFDALISANIRQTEAYMDLVSQVAKSLTTFINDTEDSIDGEMILQFLSMVLPNDSDEPGTKVKVGERLSNVEARELNDAVRVEGIEDDPPFENVEQNNNEQQHEITQDIFNHILTAVAKRIAADKYTMLKEMVKMGVMRIVVEHGVIETRLTFNTFSRSFSKEEQNNYDRGRFAIGGKAKTGWFLRRWVKASASTSYNNLTVSTAKETNQDVHGSSVQIYGRVQINFKTDYQPLVS